MYFLIISGNFSIIIFFCSHYLIEILNTVFEMSAVVVAKGAFRLACTWCMHALMFFTKNGDSTLLKMGLLHLDVNGRPV